VNGVTGVLVPPKDPGALAEAVSRLLADTVLARRFGSAGRALVEEKFSEQVMVGRVERLYGELLRRRLSRRSHR
jgi:glycosyltransferase involved in cell wall biosynthesis